MRTRTLPVVIVLLALTAVFVAACGEGAGGGADRGAATADGAGTGDTDGGGADLGGAPTVGSAEGTPTRFEALRDALRDRLDSFGVNIGAVPGDIRDQLLAQCRELADLAQRERVDAICQDIERAMDVGDPGLIDLVLEQLAALTPD